MPKIGSKTAIKFVQLNDVIAKKKEELDALYEKRTKMAKTVIKRCGDTELVVPVVPAQDEDKPFRRVKIVDKTGQKVYKNIAFSEDNFFEVTVTKLKNMPKTAK